MSTVQTEKWMPIMQSATGGALTVLGEQITMARWCGIDLQRWKFTELDGGWYRIENKATGKVLDGSNGHLYPHVANAGSYQRWQVNALGDGFTLVQQESGNVVDGNGTTTYLNTFNGGAYQQWKQDVEVSIDTTLWAPITQTASGKVLTIADSQITMSVWGSTDDQLWQFAEREPGWYQIVNKANQLVLDGNGNSLYPNTSNGGGYQLWKLTPLGESSFALVQQATGKILDGNGTQTYYNTFNGGGYQQWTQGARLLHIPQERPYNQITFAMAHDSHTATHYYRDSDSVQENVDQTQPVSGQLMGGIRAMRVSHGYWNRYPQQPYQVFLQHGDPNTFPGDQLGGFTVFGKLVDYMTQVRDFLLQHPNQLVTIIDEGSPNDADNPTAFAAQVVADYKSVFGDMLFSPNTYGLTVEQLQAGQWPTVAQLTQKGPCVILFMASSAYAGLASFMLPAYCPSGIVAMNNYDAYEGDNQLRPTPSTSWFTKSDRIPVNGNPPAPLWLFNHQFTQSLPLRTESSRAYNKWTVGDLLIEDTIRFWMLTQHKPNFINVDFYQGVWGAHSYTIDIANTLNRVSSPEEVTAQWGGLPILIEGTNNLQIGNTYLLRSAANRNNAITLAANGAITFESADSANTNQHWHLVYNSPAPGVALVHVAENGDCTYLTAGVKETPVTGTTYAAALSGTDETGWQIGADGDSWWIRRSLDQSTHMEGRGEDCGPGTVIETWGWNGGSNQHFIFDKV